MIGIEPIGETFGPDLQEEDFGREGHLIEVENLSKSYGNFAALKGACFRIEPGERVGLLGPNGAGKTTTLRILAGFIPPSGGSVRIGGYDLRTHPIEVRRRIGYLPETVPLYKEMTVQAFLLFMGSLRGLKGKKLSDRVETMMQHFGLENQASTLIAKLSKGYRQLVGIAQAMVHEPEVLILDEPTIGIDPRQVVQVRERIKEYGRRHTVILSSHILAEVGLICDRIMVMDRGRILAVDRPEKLAAELGVPSVYEITVVGDEQEIKTSLSKVPGVLRVSVEGPGPERRYRVETQSGSDLRQELSRAISEKGFTLIGLTSGEMALEDLFLRLTRPSTDKE